MVFSPAFGHFAAFEEEINAVVAAEDLLVPLEAIKHFDIGRLNFLKGSVSMRQFVAFVGSVGTEFGSNDYVCGWIGGAKPAVHVLQNKII